MRSDGRHLPTASSLGAAQGRSLWGSEHLGEEGAKLRVLAGTDDSHPGLWREALPSLLILGRLCHSCKAEELEPSTWLYPCQHNIFSAGFSPSGAPPFPIVEADRGLLMPSSGLPMCAHLHT